MIMGVVALGATSFTAFLVVKRGFDSVLAGVSVFLFEVGVLVFMICAAVISMFGKEELSEKTYLSLQEVSIILVYVTCGFSLIYLVVEIVKMVISLV